MKDNKTKRVSFFIDGDVSQTSHASVMAKQRSLNNLNRTFYIFVFSMLMSISLCWQLSEIEFGINSALFRGVFYLGLSSIMILPAFKNMFLNLEIFLNEVKAAPYNGRAANFIAGLATLFFKKYHGLGEQKLIVPKEAGSVIVAANHPSGLVESGAIMVSLGRPISPIATSSYNKIPGAKSFLEMWGTIFAHFPTDKQPADTSSTSSSAAAVSGPVKKNSATTAAAIAGVMDGKNIFMYPAGDNHWPGNTEPEFRQGVMNIAKTANLNLVAAGKKPNVYVLPVFVSGINSKIYGRPIFGLFKPSSVKLQQYPWITPEQSMACAEPIEFVNRVLKPILSMKYQPNGWFATRDEIHDEMAEQGRSIGLDKRPGFQ